MASYSSLTNNDVETYFAKVMSPIKKEADPNVVAQFCQKLSNNIDGIQTAIRLITNKMQSQQEWESLIALYVLEACVKNCGPRFHAEIGKFRFLNEMIKLVSPKYLANQTSEKVKKRVIEIMYSWTKVLSDEPKIVEAYDMLKRQGIVERDPTNVDILVINVPPRTKNPVFEDPDKTRKLEKLLQSKNPQDLEEANRLIKQMVKQDEIKTEKISIRINELDQINNNVKLLNEMLFHFNKATTSESERETMKFIFDDLEKCRESLVKLATETDDNDDGIGDIVATSEAVDRILNQYKTIVDNESLLRVDNEDDTMINTLIQTEATDTPRAATTTTTRQNDRYDPLKELQDLFSAPATSNDKPPAYTSLNLNNDFGSFTDEPPLMATTIPLSQSNPAINSAATTAVQSKSSFDDLLGDLNRISVNSQLKPLQPLTPMSNTSSKNSLNNIAQAPVSPKPKSIDGFNDLGRSLLEHTLTSEKKSQPQSQSIQPLESLILKNTTKKLPSLNEMQNHQQLQIQSQQVNAGDEHADIFNSLNNLIVPLESIKPGSKAPLTIYEKNGLKIIFHFGRDSPQLHVYVIVVSITSTSPSPISKISFQAAVPKKMRVKLQLPSTSELPGYNPILPLSAVTQVMLIANPTQEKVKLRYKVNYQIEDKSYNDFADIDELPVGFELL